ncbi:MAG TPA: DUF2304 domain-containing protein [Puia sp.]|nr:DUF2304 domain-containing protein [Puia sp.]
MKIIQIILLVALLLLFVGYLRRFRKPVIDKLLVSLLLLSGIVFVIYPELTNRLAHLLGIGRGADLIFYLAILIFGYIVLILYSKINKLENMLIELIRKQSLNSIDLQQQTDA